MNKLGMYDPSFEHDACGLGFVAEISGLKSRRIIDMGLEMLLNLNHRGAVGADEFTGDGAGITIQMPDKFIRKVCFHEGIILPGSGRYAVGMIFLPQNSVLRKACQTIIEKIIDDEDQIFLGWRNVPINPDIPGKASKLMMPFIRQCFIQANDNISSQEEFERKLFLIRRIIDHRIRTELNCDRSKYYVPSFSSRIMIYKGMLLANQMPEFYYDLKDEDLQSAFAMIHLRFSTNTFPTWDLAHPFRMIAHNGEINTLRGNKNWMAAREAVMESEYFGKDLKRMLPIIMEGQSDSATFDTVLELLVLSGRSLPHAMMMMIPEAWSKNDKLDKALKAFYEYHATFMEPWDGPAAIVFTDGNLIGASLDRNGLRPARYILTNDNLVILSSESGVLNIPEENINKKGKLQPGKMFLVDLSKGKLLHDLEVKDELTNKKPYDEWVKKNILRIDDLPSPLFKSETDHREIFCLQKTFGYTSEDLNIVMMPMIERGEEAVGSMGTDVSLAVLSEKPQLLFRYFKQVFAQVTNPPIDPIREELVMELTTYIGPEQNLLSETPQHAHRIELKNPLLSNTEFEKLKALSTRHFRSMTISILFDNHKRHSMRERLDEICGQSVEAVRNGFSLLILSDKGSSEFHTAIPSLLAVSAIHHVLIKNGLRTKTGIIIQSGEPREVSHFALLCGYGANAINPYLAYDSIKDMFNRGQISGIPTYKDAKKNFVKAVSKGLFKVFSKMGISTLQSYCGAQIFEAVGLDSELVSKYFTGTPTKIEGLSLEMLEDETLKRHRAAYDEMNKSEVLDNNGLYQYRRNGEHQNFRKVRRIMNLRPLKNIQILSICRIKEE
jgi:glutamate synthase domain-containing protein 1